MPRARRKIPGSPGKEELSPALPEAGAGRRAEIVGWSSFPHLPHPPPPPELLPVTQISQICWSREAQGQGRSQSGLGGGEAQKVGARWEFSRVLGV